MLSRMRHAKIVCTIGPAVDSPEAIRELIEAGMDVARLNFSHGTHDEHARRAEWIRKASLEMDKPVAILQDLCGPKIRTGRRGPEEVQTGQSVKLIAGEEGTEDAIAIGYEHLVRDLQEGDRILLGDGEIELHVREVNSSGVVCRVEHGGPLRDRMGANLPSGRVRLDTITAQDRKDLAFGLAMEVDYVALSFVRSAGDIAELRALCEQAGRPTPIVPKIETPAAVENIEEIAKVSDALMLARGDLGVELSPEAVPVVQKHVLEVCRANHCPVIIATEMLQSMVEAPRPTRAEASDVANAVFDGADAVMLSAETASGGQPVRACATMARIIEEAEASPHHELRPSESGSNTPEAIARGACNVAHLTQARGIVVFSRTGATARLVSKARPDRPVIGFAPEERALRRMALYWGVWPQRYEMVFDADHLAASVSEYLKRRRLVESGQRVVMVFGTPLGQPGSTNSIRVETIR
jgi:pyruvate kinase